MKKLSMPLIVIFAVILLDQIVKITVKLSFIDYAKIVVVPSFFELVFTENAGMAFGIGTGGSLGRIILVLFRTALIVFLFKLLKKQVKLGHTGTSIAFSLIIGGAIGNLVDNLLYGLIFENAFVIGRVVDMFYFPLWGLNKYIFNLADAAITIGLVIMIISFKENKKNKEVQ